MNLEKMTSPEYLKMLQFYEFFNNEERLDLVPRKTSAKSTEFRKQGNEMYQRKQHDETASHRRILSLYNQSMAYAPNDSEELALALSNRSVLWLHLEKYDLCLNDVKKALGITNSSELKNKLTTRQMKCLRLNQSSAQSKKKLNDLPSFKQSESVACAADCLKLEYNEKFGRHYTATRDIKPGEIVISEKSPFVFVKPKQMYLACSHCLTFAWNGLPCESCVFAIYCSEGCKKEAWSQYHDIHCGTTSLLNCKGLEQRNLFHFDHLTKMVIIIVKQEGLMSMLEEAKQIHTMRGDEGVECLLSHGKLDCEKFKTVYSLAKAGTSDQDDEVEDCIPIVVSLLLKFLIDEWDSCQNEIDIGMLITSMEKILSDLNRIYNCNTYSFQTLVCSCADGYACGPDCLSKRGSMVAPCSSLINHSCDANVSRMCIPGSRVVLFTLRPVKKGEQICTTYGPDPKTMRKEDRRARLLGGFGFICRCKACEENWSNPPEMPSSAEINGFWSRLPRSLLQGCMNISAIVRKPKHEWSCSEELLTDAIQVIDTIYKHFDDQRAYLLSEPFRYFIDVSFFHLYGENVDLSDTC